MRMEKDHQEAYHMARKPRMATAGATKTGELAHKLLVSAQTNLKTSLAVSSERKLDEAMTDEVVYQSTLLSDRDA